MLSRKSGQGYIIFAAIIINIINYGKQIPFSHRQGCG